MLLSLLLAPGASAAPRPQKDPGEASLLAGQAAIDEGSYSTAVELLRDALAARPSARAYLLLGNAQVQLGQLDEARKSYDEALKLEKRGPRRAQIEKLIAALAGMAQARLHIESTPPGATVYVDLKAAGARGKTPLDLALLPGRHRIMLALEGHDEALAVPDPIAIEGQTINVEVSLQRRGCDVVLGGKQKGLVAAIDATEQIPLPTTVRVGPGKHEVVLSGRGLQPLAVPFECADFKPIRIDQALADVAGGLLHVHADAGANIYIDGQPVTVAAAGKLTVGAGSHDVQVEAPGNPPWHAVVVVRSGEQTDVTPRFHPASMGITGLEVVPVPGDGALVWLDGKPLPAAVMTATKPGPHLVEARRRGHRPFRREITLDTGEITRIEARLQKNSQAPLAVGIAFTVLAAGAEAGALYARSRAGAEVLGSPEHRTWRDLELAGHVTAGSCAAVAIVGWVVDAALRRKGLEAPAAAAAAPRVSAALAPAPGGGALVVQGTF